MNDILKATRFINHYSSEVIDFLKPILGLLSRLYIAKIFFSAGLTKVNDWDTTLFLFEAEYEVPYINFEVAAYLGTFGEILFPILLFIGLFSRFSALALFVVNIVAVISLTDIAPAAFYLHVIWGILLTYVIAYGGGFLSLDNYSQQLFGSSNPDHSHQVSQHQDHQPSRS